MDDLQAIINDVIELTDFQAALNGLGELDPDSAMLTYIQKTRDAVAAKPSMVSSQQNASQIIEMYDYLIENWHTENKFKAIELLAEKEEELFEQGFINYDKSDLSISDTAKHSGFFSLIAELYDDEIDELDGLGQLYDDEQDGFSGRKERKERRAKRKEKRKIRRAERGEKEGLFRKIVSKLNKVNPVTIAVRNALRGLIALNFLGMASVLSSENDKAKGVLEKVQKMYKTMGGKNDKLMKSIQNGSKRKALFNKKMQEKLESGTFKGTDGLGEPISIGGMMVAAGAFFLKIWNWIKGAGLKVKEKIPTDDIKISTSNPNIENVEEEKESSNLFQTGKRLDKNIKTENKSEDTKKNWKKPVLITAAVLTLGGLTWWGVQSSKPNTKTVSKPKVKSKPKTDQLAGITFK
jgi:hypothetical protein